MQRFCELTLNLTMSTVCGTWNICGSVTRRIIISSTQTITGVVMKWETSSPGTREIKTLFAYLEIQNHSRRRGKVWFKNFSSKIVEKRYETVYLKFKCLNVWLEETFKQLNTDIRDYILLNLVWFKIVLHVQLNTSGRCCLNSSLWRLLVVLLGNNIASTKTQSFNHF